MNLSFTLETCTISNLPSMVLTLLLRKDNKMNYFGKDFCHVVMSHVIENWMKCSTNKFF